LEWIEKKKAKQRSKSWAQTVHYNNGERAEGGGGIKA
jgi:hypothetical protein